LYGFGVGVIVSVGYGFLRVFVPLMLLGELSRSDWSCEGFYVGLFLLCMVKLLLWWVL
jgi:hypothetical protein